MKKNVYEMYKKDITFLESLSNLPSRNYILGKRDRSTFVKRLRNFLTLVGNPQNHLKVIHIAGTSGKGTTVNVLQDILINSGLKVGSYTSPYASTTIEKLRINDKLISPEILHDILEKKIKPALDKYLLKFPTEPISYFEAFLALGLLYFKQEKCDYTVLETGLGGRYDATNVVPNPIITAITNIGLDHTEILGDTKEKIARDKAGIIKEGSRFLTTEKTTKIKNIFKRICKKENAEYIELEKLIENYKNTAYFSTTQQLENLNLALNITKALNIEVKSIEKILKNFSLPCRQEIIQKKPLVILDGAHNTDKLKNVFNFINTKKYNKLHLILGFSFDKEYKPTLKNILPIADYTYLTRFLTSKRKSADLKKLYKISTRHTKKPIKMFFDPYNALKAALKKADKDDAIVVAGSFYLAGELRKYWISEEKILKNLKIDR